MSTQILKKLFTLWFLLLLMLGSGCAPSWWVDPSSTTDAITAEQGGEGDLVLHLMAPSGKAYQCVQGAGGTYSHTGASTKHDLDFDTSNTVQEEVFAPVSGVARVHTESATANFGYHVNIDVGEEEYIVIAHMDEIFVEDGEEVALGQLIGFEGCTGSCTGDHIHIGRHKGKAEQKAEFGTSIKTSYFAQDVTADGEFKVISSDAFICGISALGDPVSGHTYRSALPTALWHPDGTLLKTPESEKVYLAEDGLAHWITDESVFWSHGYRFEDVALISEKELACLGKGADIYEEGLVEAAYSAETGSLWLIVGSSGSRDRFRQRVRSTAWEQVLHSWGTPYSAVHVPPLLSPDHAYFTDWPARDGYATFRTGSLVSPQNASDVFAISGNTALPIKDWETYLLLGFYDREILQLQDGDLQTIQKEIGSCQVGIQCIDHEAVTACGGGLELGEGDQGGIPGEEPLEDTGDLPDPPCTDADQDGYCNEASGGTDCWDQNAFVHPGAAEICGDGIDQDCSGTDLPCDAEVTDTDGDGVMDSTDNCPFHDNPGQEDADQDGLGDSCDQDADGDGTLNAEDCDMFDPAVGLCGQDTGGEEDTDPPAPPALAQDTLTVSWATPFHMLAQEITISGEYVFADGTYGFTWRELAQTRVEDSVIYVIDGVSSGDHFRFSIEYEDALGNISWSCIGPFPPGMTQGVASADVDGITVPIHMTGDPTGLTTGCGLILHVP